MRPKDRFGRILYSEYSSYYDPFHHFATNFAEETRRNCVVISGLAFDPIAANNSVVLNNGAVGTVTAASATSLTVTLSAKPTASDLTAIVTTNGVASGAAVRVAKVIPVITSCTANASASSQTVIINGFGFSILPKDHTVTFNNGAVGTVTTASKTSITVSFKTKPVSAGSLTAVVALKGAASGSAVQIATVVPGVTSSTAFQAITANPFIIRGFGFSKTLANNTVVLNQQLR